MVSGISYMEDETFSNLQELKHLDLHLNSLVELRPEMFSGLESIEYTNLWGNSLTTLSADVFKHLPCPLELRLSNFLVPGSKQNLLTCDSDLCWLKVEELKETITWTSHQYKARCVEGIDWDKWSCQETGATPCFVSWISLLG